MNFLFMRNTVAQDVATDGLVNLGFLVRQHYDTSKCGTRTFDANNGAATLQLPGIYEVIVTAVASGDAAGDVTLQLLENGEVIPGAFSTETITTATTELRTFTILTYVLVNNGCLLGQRSTLAKTLTLQNTGVDATIESVNISIKRMYSCSNN